MKKINFMMLFCLLAITAQAQKTEPTDYKNNIQFNPLGLVFGNIEFQYEHPITEQSTVSLGVGIKPFGGILKVSGFDSPVIKTGDFSFTGFSITPEYRWYFQKNTKIKHTGLYVGGYYKFKSINDNISGTYTSQNTGTTSPIDVDADIMTHSFGAMFGYKIMISKKIYFDILIAGPGYTSAQLKITENEPLPPEFYVDVASELADKMDIVADVIDDIDINEISSNKGKGRFGLPAFRYGFKIGFSF